jgi:hypothetical protein
MKTGMAELLSCRNTIGFICLLKIPVTTLKVPHWSPPTSPFGLRSTRVQLEVQVISQFAIQVVFEFTHSQAERKFQGSPFQVRA